MNRTPRMMKFITEVNKIYFNEDQENMNKLLQLLDSMEEESKTCVVCMKSGAKKGQPCGKPTVSNNMCGTHLKSYEKEDKKETDENKTKKSKKEDKENSENDEKENISEHTCTMVLKSGKNKGNACGKKCDSTMLCALHSKSKEKVKKEEKDDEKKENEDQGQDKEDTENKICKGTLKNGMACSKKVSEGDMCKIHMKEKEKEKEPVVDEKDKLTLRIKRDGENYLIKGTNVMFDMTTQTIIGYKKDGSYILEENDETKEACASYKLKFK